jgi:hypothetical protein
MVARAREGRAGMPPVRSVRLTVRTCARTARRITVSYIYRDYYDDRFWTGSRKFPVLCFGGEWLAQAVSRSGSTCACRRAGSGS